MAKKEDMKLPVELRKLFAQPLDELIAGTREETIPMAVEKFKALEESNIKFEFYLVGDIVSIDFLNNDYLKKFIKLCIIDEKTQRKRVEINTSDFFEEYIEFKNPAGAIQKESWPLLKGIVDSKKTTLLMITEGEEDMLVLPLVEVLPIDTEIQPFVFYGQPPITDAEFTVPQGLVVVKVNKRMRRYIKGLVKKMEMFRRSS